MADVIVEKSADDLRREIDELHRQQREITERLRDPRGLRKAGNPGAGGRGAGPGRLLGRGAPQRGAVRRADPIDIEEQPPAKKRLLSAVVKVDDDDAGEEPEKPEAVDQKDEKIEVKEEELKEPIRKPFLQRGYGGGRREFRGGNRGFVEPDSENTEPVPRVMPKDDPNVAKRNRRMFGALLGTLEKFRQEDKKLSGSEAFMRRSTSQKRAEQRAHEESERLRQQEREQLAEKRKRDLILRARLVAKAEEKQLEVLFIQWTEHQSKLWSFVRTKAEPAIFYMPAKASEETDKLLEEGKQDFAEWKTQRRAELTEYQKQCTEDHLAKVELDIERWRANQQGNSTEPQSNVADETEDMDGTGEGDRVPGKLGRHRSRELKELDNGEEDQDEDVPDEEAKTDTESEAKADPIEVEVKPIVEEPLDSRKEDDDQEHGALKDVLGYVSGGEGDMEER